MREVAWEGGLPEEAGGISGWVEEQSVAGISAADHDVDPESESEMVCGTGRARLSFRGELAI